MVCKVCGHINQDSVAKFCTVCGSELQHETYQPVYQQPSYNPPPRVPNYLVFSILTTILCCLPLGIAAIFKSAQVDKKIALGEYEAAIQTSKQARTLNILAAVLGVVFSIFYVIIVVIAGTTLK